MKRTPQFVSKSFYLLGLWVDPGAADYYIYNNLDDIKRVLEQEMSAPDKGAYLVLCHGETLRLAVYQKGTLVWEKDLHPSITFVLPGYPPLQGTEDGRILGLDLPSSLEEDTKEDKQRLERIRDDLYDLLYSMDERDIRVEIDWKALALPPLQEPLLQPGEMVLCSISYHGEGDAQLEYGVNAIE